MSDKKEAGGDAVGSMEYDANVKRRSLEDPHRHYRRSSIPFADRKPAVRFIRSIDSRKSSQAGPHNPKGNDPKKPILKTTNFPILVSGASDVVITHKGSGVSGSISTTNDELEACKYKTELIMDKISRAERIARGSMDVLTFPTSTRRVEPLSRYQGCMTICTCAIAHYTQTDEYKEKRKSNKKSHSVAELTSVVDIAHSLSQEGSAFLQTAKKFLHIAKKRYYEWEELLKRNSEFKIEQNKLCYPIYTHKKMPESVTLFEDSMEQEEGQNSDVIDGYLRVFRKFPEGNIWLFCDMPEDKSDITRSIDPISFMESGHAAQQDIIKYLTTHGRDLVWSGNFWLKQGLEVLQDSELDDTFKAIQQKINSLEYDDYFDPLCALELKTALGELVTRKAELLNTAEQIVSQCRWLVKFGSVFHRFAKRRIKGGNACVRCLTCAGKGSKLRLLHLLGLVSVEDVTILMPLTVTIYRDIFRMTLENPAEKTESEKQVANKSGKK